MILSKQQNVNGTKSHVVRLQSNMNLASQMTLEPTLGNHNPTALGEWNGYILVAGKLDFQGGKATVYGLNSTVDAILVNYISPLNSSEYGAMKIKNNNIYLAGSHINLNGQRQGLVQRALASTNLQFNYEHQIEQSYASSNITATSIDVDNNGDAFALFTTKNAVGKNNWLLISYDAAGIEDRRYSFDQAGETDKSQKVIAENNGAVLFGRSTSAQASENATVVRLVEEDIVDIPSHDNQTRSLYNTLIHNYGQVGSFGPTQSSAKGVNYFSYQSGYYDFIGDGAITFQPIEIADEPSKLFDVNRIDMTFIGGKLINQVPVDKGELLRNYYMGHTERGVEAAEEYGSILFGTIYEGIDLKYTHNSAGTRMFFRVSPTGNYSSIKMELTGVTSTSIVGDQLVLANPVNDLIFVEPIAYQIITGVATIIPITYTLNGAGEVSFNLTGEFDKDKDLYIYMGFGDNPPAIPKDAGDNMEFSTYFGESPITVSFDVDVDQLGNAHYTGKTNSAALLASFGLVENAPFAASEDAYVAKFNNEIVPQWYTYFGGSLGVSSNSGDEVGIALAVDELGDRVYVTGETYSTDLPVLYSGTQYNDPGGITCQSGSPNGCAEIFVSRFNANGILQWSTYFGGENGETCRDIEIDRFYNTYIVGKRTQGSTVLTDLTGASNSTAGTALLLKFNDQNELLWATGIEAEIIKGVSADGNGNIVIVGNSVNNAMVPLNPPLNPNTTSFNGGASDGFVARYNSNGVLTHNFYYGGNCKDELTDVGTDAGNNIYICGKTFEINTSSLCRGSTNLPVLGNGLAIPSGASGTDQNHFIAKFDPMIPSTPTVISHAGYFGGELQEVDFNSDGFAIRWTEVKLAVSKSGIVAMSGTTASASTFGSVIHMPAIQPSGFFVQADRDLNTSFSEDAYLAVFNENFEFKYSTYFGDGRLQDAAAGLSYSESDGRLYWSGNTDTQNALYSNPLEKLIMEPYDPIATTDYYFDFAMETQRPAWIAFFDLNGLNIPSSVGLTEISENQLSVYPNPTSHDLHVGFDENIDDIRIYDLSGRMVLDQSGVGTKSVSINLASLEAGSYLVLVESGHKVMSTKFIKL